MILATLLVLAACSTPGPVTGFRDPSRQVYSSAVFDPERVTGAWRQVADFATDPGCSAAGVRFSSAGSITRIDGQLCLAGVPTEVAGPLIPTGPGRFGLTGLPDPIWVLWADVDLRTMVLGTPSGRFAVILNRDGKLPPDRLTAARDVLEWNGYDLDRLRITP